MPLEKEISTHQKHYAVGGVSCPYCHEIVRENSTRKELEHNFTDKNSAVMTCEGFSITEKNGCGRQFLVEVERPIIIHTVGLRESKPEE